ncbi:MAG: OpgC domain-containing protein [Sulfitobacter litoralis]|uniref:OpgC protein n=2 Tax=Sulfitobacter TaxID=60136 RepID=A0ABY0SJS5_9RHOB|nr:OpgC domain-containing protein [Sulfitobacter litoralis]SDP32067.1 hypothetical protein SAMN04488512_11351 [Sulfitobacter litoralis]
MTQSSNRPDAQLIPIRRGVDLPRRARDPRIDAFRGLALIMIIIDHMPGNPWEHLTIRNIGFSDAAEAFFIMSGIAAGIAYSPAIGRWMSGDLRLWDAIAPLWRRAWQLYIVHIVLTVAAIGLYAWAADTFVRSEFRVMHNLALLYEQTGAAMAGLVTLGYQIGYVNILPSYTVLLLAGPVLIAAVLYAPRTTLAVAGAFWLYAGATRLTIPNHPGGGGWFFNPLTWQLIFVIGLAIGVRHRKGERLVRNSALLFKLAVSVLLFIAAWRYVPGLGSFMNHKMAQLGGIGLPANIVTHNKSMLALPRLVHVLALVYVLSCLPIVTRICAHRLAAPFRLMGSHGLLVFGLGTILALAGQIMMDIEATVTALPWILPPVAVAVCYVAALLAEAARKQPQPKQPAAASSRHSPTPRDGCQQFNGLMPRPSPTH